MKPPPLSDKQQRPQSFRTNYSSSSSSSSRFHPNRSNTYTIIVFLLASILISILVLTGFVCTHKIQAEEECLSANILCYECDSRYDPNCADPFEFPAWYLDQQQYAQPPPNNSQSMTTTNNARTDPQSVDNQDSVSVPLGPEPATASMNITTIPRPPPKKLPAANVCHGCCVKITSKTLDGVVYVKRTCTTNLQINYFMVGLVCMKESGDRGKMCFCETDYCNGQSASLVVHHFGGIISVIFATILMRLVTFSSQWSNDLK